EVGIAMRRDSAGLVAVLILLNVAAVEGQRPDTAVLQRATRPLDYLPVMPSDPCRYSPCPRPSVTLDRLTGGLSPTRTFDKRQQIQIAVINLNPFLHRNIVTVVAKPLDPNAAVDFIQPPLAMQYGQPPPAPGVGMALYPPCNVPDEQRARLRLDAGRLRQAQLRMQSWLTDSLAGPRNAVTGRIEELEATLSSDASAARDLYGAAWQYHELTRIYVPAVRASGLADSTRIVPLAAYHKPFADEVAEIQECRDDEVSRWQELASATAGTLSEARYHVTTSQQFTDQLAGKERAYWTRAAVPGNFFIVRAAGGYETPMNVFVRLYRFSVNKPAPAPSELRDQNAYAGWTLIFR
ncbi:MAG TPA: hypothetical protein VF021_12760, partial [Longimicrobiales bacterium]